MVDNEMLLAISNLLDTKLDAKLEPIKNDIRNIQLHLENIVDPKLQLIYENYVPASQKYENSVALIEKLQTDVEILKEVVASHSEQLKKAQ